ncbi:hypothetical protein ABPG75_005608 [Micractinium tetrahymenae]
MQSTACRATVAAPASSPWASRRAFAPAAAPSVRSAAPRRQLRCLAVSTEVKADAKFPAWEAIYAQLTGKYGTRTVSPEEAFDMAQLGKAVVIDVRPREDFDKGRPKGAVHVPAFIVIDSPSSPGEFGKWLACKANGVVPTKVNADLPAQIAAAAADGKVAVLACEAGGTLQPTVSFPQGKVSRSLKAAWKVLATGALPAERVLHLDGGVYGWYRAGMPMDGEYDGTGAGRTPNTAETPTGQFFDKQ